MDTSVNAANQVVSVGADIALDADPKFFACLVRFESSSVPTTLPTAYDVYPLDGRHDGGYYTVKDCVTIVFFFQAEDGIRYYKVTGVQTCALPICTFNVTERFALQFRADAANLFNTPHFLNPNGSRSSGNFLRITSAKNDERQFRFGRSEEHTSELQSPCNLVCRLLLEKKKNNVCNNLMQRNQSGPYILRPHIAHEQANINEIARRTEEYTNTPPVIDDIVIAIMSTIAT